MTDEIVEKLKELEPTFLRRDKRDKSFVCPRCNNGTGDSKRKYGSGLAFKDGHYHCFSCGLHEDTIGLYRVEHDCDFKTAIKELSREYAIDVSSEQGDKRRVNIPLKQDTYLNGAKNSKRTEDMMEQSVDYKELYLTARQNAEKDTEGVFATYLKERGIERSTAEHFNLGYMKKWNSSINSKAYMDSCIVVPYTEDSYEVKTTDLQRTQMKVLKEGRAELYNACELNQLEEPVFIVEGTADVWSLYQVGARALALGSTSNIKLFIDELSKRKQFPLFILALDNDSAGQKAEQEIQKQLDTLGVLSYRAMNIYGESKDANDLLIQGGATSLKEKVKDALHSLLPKEWKTSNIISAVHNDLFSNLYKPIPTGLTKLDKHLNGGLIPSLYMIGAIPSLGKTTLAVQIADHIAYQGKPVMFVTLEMSSKTLAIKSIIRECFKKANANTDKEDMSLNCLEEQSKARCNIYHKTLTQLDAYESLDANDKKLLASVKEEYLKKTTSLFYVEGVGGTGVKEISEHAMRLTKILGESPVVFVDYTQILAPVLERGTDKMNVDKSIQGLKVLSRDLDTPVVAISSLNRESYTKDISMTCFKESGGIEYGVDVLLGLQFTAQAELRGQPGGAIFNPDEEKKKTPRYVQIKILKNRNGATGTAVNLCYYTPYNCFIECYQ